MLRVVGLLEILYDKGIPHKFPCVDNYRAGVNLDSFGVTGGMKPEGEGLPSNTPSE